MWQNRLAELNLRFELERLRRVETQTQLELHRREKVQAETRQFLSRSGSSATGLRFDLGNTYQKHQRSSVDRIVFGHDIDGSEEVEGFQGEDWSMKPTGKKRMQHIHRTMASSVDRIVFGRDIDQSEEVGGFQGEDWSMQPGRNRWQHNQRTMASSVDMAIFGRDQDGSNDHPEQPISPTGPAKPAVSFNKQGWLER